MNPGVPMRQAAAELASLQPLQPPRSTPAGAASSHPHHAGEESPGFGREAAPGRCPPARRRHGAPCAPRCSPPRPMIGCACVLAWPLPSDRASSRRGSRRAACLRILIPTSTVRGQWGSAMPTPQPPSARQTPTRASVEKRRITSPQLRAHDAGRIASQGGCSPSRRPWLRWSDDLGADGPLITITPAGSPTPEARKIWICGWRRPGWSGESVMASSIRAWRQSRWSWCSL